jgi:hypothetical protein
MKKGVLGLALLVVGMLTAPRNAAAEEVVDTGGILGVVGFASLDLGFGIADLNSLVTGERHSRGVGAFEATVGAGQIAFCVGEAYSVSRYGAPVPIALRIGAGLGVLLMAHGLVTLVAPGSHTEAPAQPPAVTVAPLALSDGARAPVPGLGVLGRF